MTEKELEQFSELWLAACENSGFKTEPSDAAINLAFDVLINYSIGDIAIAIVKYQRMSNKQLTPTLIESIITGCFWMSADEAWGLAQRTFDSTRSVVVTKEIITAASKVESMYNGGERTAAKNTFIAIYERLMMTAISAGKSPKWQVWQLEQPTRENSTEHANRLAIEG